MSVLITPDQLSSELTSVRVFDCRYDLEQPGDGERRFHEGHIPEAQYISLDKNLMGPLAQHGGRHPLPSVEALQSLFGRLGIESGKTPVVVYDDEGGCYAARLWWMLRYCGHDNVRLLDGGWTAWKEFGGDITTGLFTPAPTDFLARPRPWMLVTMKEVRDRTASEILFDCRAEERFSGAEESIDAKAGHIPGALNVPWRGMVEENGRLVEVGRMADALSAVDGRSILYCGSGVTACVNVLAAVRAGLDLPRLYAGSWSDWISYDENQIATGS